MTSTLPFDKGSRSPGFGSCKTARRPWVCADGTCALSPVYCGGTTAFECVGQPGIKKCPLGYCASSEKECMRPCNFTQPTRLYTGQTTYTWNKRCPGFDNLCLLDHHGYVCPKKCPPGKKYCGRDKCWDYCNSCSAYRCPDTGKCYSFSDRCDGYKDCPGGADETGCSTYSGGGSRGRGYDEDGGMMVVKISPVALMLAFLCCAIAIKRHRHNAGRTRFTRRDSDLGSSRVVMSGTRPVPPTNVMEAISRPGYPSSRANPPPPLFVPIVDPYSPPLYVADTPPSYPGAAPPYPSIAVPGPASPPAYSPSRGGTGPPPGDPPAPHAGEDAPPAYSEVMHILPPQTTHATSSA